MTSLSDEFNNWKERYEKGIKAQNKLIESVLTLCDRELLIKILKKRRIIKRDWLQENQVYEMSIPQDLQGKEMKNEKDNSTSI